jgi:bisanhydrobacterioruberin hydratase
MKGRSVILTALSGCYLLLWLGGVVSYLWWGRTPAGASWAAPAFLFLAGLIVLVAAEPAYRIVLLVVAASGFTAEAIGVHFGVPFGRYHYTATLQPQILGVPLVMAAAWLVLVAYVKEMLAEVRLPTWIKTLCAALWMTALDLVIDPLAAGGLDYWRWATTGSYYGIPLQNFFGWFAVSWFIFSFLSLIRKTPLQRIPGASLMGFSILLFFTVIAIGFALKLVVSIGAGLCLLHFGITYGKKENIHRGKSLRSIGENPYDP